MPLKLANGFAQMADAILGLRSSQIVTGMTGNTNFPKPTPPLAEGNKLVTSYLKALDNCGDGDRQKIAKKNQLREQLVTMLHSWGLYVLLQSNNDAAIAMESGFQIAKVPAPAPPLTKPATPVLESGINPGEIISKGKRDLNALVYLHQYATEAEMQADRWASKPCSKATCVLTGLVPGTKYYCRMVVVGRKDQLVYSDVVTRIAA